MKIVILSNQIEARTARLQPNRTLIDMGLTLKALGHEVMIFSNQIRSSREPENEVDGLKVLRLKNTRLFRGLSNHELIEAVKEENPDRIIWHLSLFSYFHQQLNTPFKQPVLGVITSPIHSAGEMFKLGARKLATNLDLVVMHLLGYFVPGFLVRHAFQKGGLQSAITLSERTRSFLISKGAPADRIHVVSPGVGDKWLDSAPGVKQREAIREQLGYLANDLVISYFGSPAPVRGLHTILEALTTASDTVPDLKLLILSRKRPGEWGKESAKLHTLITHFGLEKRVRVIEGFLDEDSLIGHILASDLVCLPFEIVPSDVPLSILEAMALKRAVISTKVASIPEILAEGRGFLITPGSAAELSSMFTHLYHNPEAGADRANRAHDYVNTQRTWQAMKIDLSAALEASVEY